MREALAKLTDHDIRVVVDVGRLGAARRRPGPRLDPPLARLASVPGCAVDRRRRRRYAGAGALAWYLLDLACARECAQADAVGFGSGETSSPTGWKGPRQGRLAWPRRPAAGDWGSHGLRLFMITA